MKISILSSITGLVFGVHAILQQLFGDEIFAGLLYIVFAIFMLKGALESERHN